jgi:hypothetical protein
MKYLKRFNESSIGSVYEHSHEVSTIINDCKDILIDLSDNNITCKVWVSGSGSIIVQIGDDNLFTSLRNMSDTFDHLFSYLESFGYLMSNKSFWEGDSWEYYESCPKCSSDEVTIDVNSEDRFGSGHKFTCDKCNYLGDSEDFQSPEWPLNKSELMWVIKDGVKFNFMRIQFDKLYKSK